MYLARRIIKMHPWHVWAVASAVFFIAEIFVPGFFLACLGVGCLASAVVSIVLYQPWVQLLVFSVATIASFFTIRPLVFKYFYNTTEDLKTNVNALPGKHARVVEDIDPLAGTGRVKIEFEEWKAVSKGDAGIRKGEKVVVEKVEGSKVYVRRI